MFFLFYFGEEDGCTRRGTRRGVRRERRGLRKGTRKRKKGNKEKTFEGDYQTKGMSVVALVKTRLSLFTYYSFTVYRWMEDGEDDN